MEMCYDGALVMPSNYAVMDEDEMTYVEGGIYISNSQIKSATKACFLYAAINPIGTTLIGLGIYKVYTILAAGIAKIAAAIGALSRVLGVVFGIIGVSAILGMGYDIADALIQKKGIDIGIKKSSWGIPYGLDVSVR